MADQMKNVMIGVFVIAALCILVFVILFLHPYVGNRGKTLHIRFSNIDKVNVGTRVTYAGKPVGEVIQIREVEFGREGPVDESGRIYLYELELQVDSSVDVFNTDEVSVRTSGLLGEKNIEITPFAPKKGEALKNIDNQVLFAKETETVEGTLKRFKDIGDKVEVALDGISETFDRIREQKLIVKFSKFTDNLVDITKALNNPKALKETVENFHLLSQNVNKSWQKLDESLSDIKVVARDARQISQDTKTIVSNISRGQGTIGKLLIGDDLYLQLNSVMAKGEILMDDINHYGILFHTDKAWQRLRARRLNLLQKLCSPQEFRNYFNDEIDQISTSLARVGMVLENEGCGPCCCDLMLDCEFKKVFSELLRRVKTIEEELRMYNIQVVDAHVHETELNQ